MAVELKVPSLGMDMEEANILRWLVEEGAEVEKGQPVLEIDTDKTSFEIESPAAGTIRGIQGAEGETMPVGATLAFIAAPGEEISAAQAEAAPAEQETPEGAAAPSGGSPAPVAASQVPQENGHRRGLRASPAARRAAAERGISLESVTGSGPHGRVYLSDVLEAGVREQAPRPEPARAPVGDGAPTAAVASAPFGEDIGAAPEGISWEPLSKVRRIGAERTTASFRDVPHFYLTRDLAVDRLLELRDRLKAKMDPVPSVNDLLSLAVARTLKDHPRLNARYADGRMAVNERVNLGIAVATDEGLVVPVVRAAESLPLKDLVRASREVVSRAREGKLAPEELSGGTFTISNLGMMGVDTFDAIINAPQAAILAVGSVRTVPEWDGESWAPRRVISGTLSVDHRVADGADGARFLMDLQAALKDWELLL